MRPALSKMWMCFIKVLYFNVKKLITFFACQENLLVLSRLLLNAEKKHWLNLVFFFTHNWIASNGTKANENVFGIFVSFSEFRSTKHRRFRAWDLPKKINFILRIRCFKYKFHKTSRLFGKFDERSLLTLSILFSFHSC